MAYLVEISNDADFGRVVRRIICVDKHRAEAVGCEVSERLTLARTDRYDSFSYRVYEVETDK